MCVTVSQLSFQFEMKLQRKVCTENIWLVQEALSHKLWQRSQHLNVKRTDMCTQFVV